jgi:hypothetical protein
LNLKDEWVESIMLDDLVKCIVGISDGLNNYESRKLGKDEIEGLRVSTVYTIDMGYETAISDSTGCWHPVERYPNKEEAKSGHKKWIEWASNRNNTKILKLGYLSLSDDELVILQRG